MRILLAPMEGVVDHHMRHTLTSIQHNNTDTNLLASSRAVNGIDICVTEFIRVTEHTLPRRVFIQSCPELKFKNRLELDSCLELNNCPELNNGLELTNSPKHLQKQKGPCPVRIQLLGSNPHSLARNARKAAMLGAPAVDLNFGCPAKTVNKNRGGACLLKETSLIAEIVSAVREAVPQHIPVTAKIRLGFDDRDSYLQNAAAIEQAGANELIVHARSKTDGYNPPAYWQCIGEINRQISIPVIANGEIWTLDDFHQCQEQSGSNDFMLGRGLLARPDLAYAIKQNAAKKAYTFLTWPEIAPHVLQFFNATCDAYPVKFTGNRLKQWLFYLQRNYKQAKLLFEDIKRTRNRQQIEQRIKADL